MKEAAMTTGTLDHTESALRLRADRKDNWVQKWIEWAPLAVLPLILIVFLRDIASWKFMWLFAGAIFAGCKWQTWWQARLAAHVRSWWRSAAYLLLWPGMDAEQFLAVGGAKPQIQMREWLSALAKAAVGATLIVAGKSALFTGHPLWSGWLGMIGLVLILHFGTFSLIALAWKSFGVRAEPIMQHPLASKSLSELWGKRWNLGFRTLSHKLVFRPLQKSYGTVAGTLGAFLASGLIHDLVISVPARGGYGLPTAYFLIQGFGVIAERSQAGQRLGLSDGIRGRVWMVAIAVGPLCLLFHPWFVTRVMLPFMHAI